MVHKQVALDVAAFLDSSEAQALAAPEREDVRRIAEVFVGICYDELGKKPRLLDGQDMHAALGHLMPEHMARKDPLADHVPDVLRAYIDHLETTQVVSQAFELRRGFEATIGEFLDTVRTGENAHHHVHAREDPFVHGAPKLGRNDPCSCGSGKKFKKCHGKNA